MKIHLSCKWRNSFLIQANGLIESTHTGEQGKQLGDGIFLTNKLVDEKTDTIPCDQKRRAFQDEASEFVQALGNEQRRTQGRRFSRKKFFDSLVLDKCVHSIKV